MDSGVFKMVHNVFITATDTDAGKTWVASTAVRALLGHGVRAKALKPIACGLDDAGRNEDIEALLSAQGMSDADRINRYCFARPVAPSQAAGAEAIEPDTLVQWCQAQSSDVETCIIEGVGGLMAPITEVWLVSDWIEAMPDCEIWLVVGCKLGAINQTLLTLEKLKQMNRLPARMIFNATAIANNAWVEPTRQAVVPFLNTDCEVSSLRCGECMAIGGR